MLSLDLMAYLLGLILNTDHPRYIEANTGCTIFDVHSGPDNIPVSRFSFDAKVFLCWHKIFIVTACVCM